MSVNKLNLKSLTMDELTGVINLYPWFGGARKELCVRMAKVGGDEWGKMQYSDAAMYVASRTLVSDIIRSVRKEDYSDKDVERLIKEYIKPDPGTPGQARHPENRVVDTESGDRSKGRDASQAMSSVTGSAEETAAGEGYPPSTSVNGRPVRVAGGDFFSPEQYASVRRDEDNVFSGFKTERCQEPDSRRWEEPEFGFCTETLAAIYADQGYFVEAKKIYSRLILRYPEKSAYFASLIEKLRQEN